MAYDEETAERVRKMLAGRRDVFVERLIGTIRREFLDHVLIWNAVDLGRKLEEFRTYYNENRVHQSLSGRTPGERSGQPPARPRRP